MPNNSQYPNGIDTLDTNKTNSTNTKDDHVYHHNILADATNKIETELGANPSGSLSTVTARLDISQNTDGTLKTTAVQTALGGSLSSTGDVIIASDTDASGSGDIITSTGGIERARRKPDGTGTDNLLLLRDRATLIGNDALGRSVFDEIYLKEGVAAIAMCFDDGPSTDYSTVYPYLRDRQIPGSFAINASRVGMSWAQIKEMHDHGMEFLCHSRSHGVVSTYSQFYDEAITFANELALTDGTWQMYVDAFVQPGSWTGASIYNFDTPAKIDLSDAGAALKSRYSVATGYITDGNVQQVNQVPALRRIGSARGIDLAVQTLANMKTKVAQARGQSGLIACGTHSFNLGVGGNNTVAQWQAIIDFLAAERDAGRVEFFTMSAGFNLRHNTTGRRNLLQDGSFAVDAAGNPVAWLKAGGAPVFTLADAPSGGSSMTIASVSDNVVLEFPAPMYRTIRIRFKAKNAVPGVNSNTRLILRAMDGSFTTIYNSLDLVSQQSNTPGPWPAVTDAYQTYECMFRVDARAGGLMIWPYYSTANSKSGAVKYADFEIYKT